MKNASGLAVSRPVVKLNKKTKRWEVYHPHFRHYGYVIGTGADEDVAIALATNVERWFDKDGDWVKEAKKTGWWDNQSSLEHYLDGMKLGVQSMQNLHDISGTGYLSDELAELHMDILRVEERILDLNREQKQEKTRRYRFVEKATKNKRSKPDTGVGKTE